jgi:hypothetical protein
VGFREGQRIEGRPNLGSSQKKKVSRAGAGAAAQSVGSFYISQVASGQQVEASQGIASGQATNGGAPAYAPEVTTAPNLAPFGEIGGAVFVPSR